MILTSSPLFGLIILNFLLGPASRTAGLAASRSGDAGGAGDGERAGAAAARDGALSR